MSKTGDLFSKLAPTPLADRLRPNVLDAVLGQDHLLGEARPLRRLLAAKRVPSLILWGPPGCGKTTLARLVADHTSLHYEMISALASGVADLRRVFEAAQERRRMGAGTLLFVDEIHRFNRAQQDIFLGPLEDGTITLIGATTENPSFEINAALLSRCQVLTLKRLDEDALTHLLVRAEEEMGAPLALDEAARLHLVAMADGDGRALLNMAEALGALDLTEPLTVATLGEALQKRAPIYDKAQEGHYNLISALHKSMRGSDVNAALYWLARMLSAGEDPFFLLRRLVRFASEDVGLADPQALGQALAAKDAYHFLGSPEGELAIVQCVIYLATAPKSNAAYVASKAALAAAQRTGSLMPPAFALNAPTKLMKNLGYGEGYAYDHDQDSGFAGQNYFPPDLPRETYYTPKERGFEREILKRLAYWEKLRG